MRKVQVNRMSKFQPSRLLLSAALISVSVGACSPVVRNHGYLPDPMTMSRLEEGLQTKREVRRMLGSPSTTGNFDGETWYYVTSVVHTFAWRRPIVTKRSVLAVKFNVDTQTIGTIAQYGIEDGRIINFSNRKTPTKGKELTFLEQLFGNVGRISANQLSTPGQN